jgi:predicted transcriptional regulator
LKRAGTRPLAGRLRNRNVENWAMSKTRNVKDVMNPDIMTVSDEMTTDELARYLIEREISGAPVVDSQGHLIGVVSMTDIGRSMAEPSDVEISRTDVEISRSSGFYRDIAADFMLEDPGQRHVEERVVTVRDVMTPVIHQVPITASVAEAARIMVDQHIHRLVVTQGKEPVGIITSMDVLKIVAEQS